MKKTPKNYAWMTASCLLAVLAGAPALADDTELLLVAPDESDLPFNSNILLIIDSSTSMLSLETTRRPYDSSITYDGTCDATKYYWSQLDVIPACIGDDGEANIQNIDKSAYACRESERQIQRVGLFSDTMVQYRLEDGSDAGRWTTLEPGNSSGTVECREDSGIHGENGGSATYAQAGSGLAEFTADPTL
jgi:hypothetical protein